MTASASRQGRIVTVGALVAIAVALAACGGSGPSATSTTSTLPPPPPHVLAYVTLIGEGSSLGTGNTLGALDLTPGASSSERTITVGDFPDAVAIAPDGKTAYVTNYSSNTLTPITIASGLAGKAIPAGDGPADVAITPDGKTAYVSDAGTSPIGDTVTEIDLKTRRIVKRITVGQGPQGIAITPDGTTAYVANAGGIVSGQSAPLGDTVTPINLTTGVAGAPITVGNAPLAVAITSDGSTAYVANSGSGSVTPITVAGNVVGTPVSLEGSPQALAISGGTLYVADDSSTPAGNNITPIPISTATAGTPIVVGSNPTGIVIAPDGASAYVVCNGTGQLVTISLGGAKLVKGAAIALPGGPYAIALASVPADEVSSALGIVASKKNATTHS